MNTIIKFTSATTGGNSNLTDNGSLVGSAVSVSINNASDGAGNLRFAASNPYIVASSYFIAPGGAYFNSGTVYFEAAAQVRGGIQNDSGNYNGWVRVLDSLWAADWVRVDGNSGIYFQTWGGGWNMVDGTWLRTYGDKAIYASGGIAVSGTVASQYGASPRIYSNWDNATGGGIAIADDGGFYDFNDAWIQFRGSTGLYIKTDTTGQDPAGATALMIGMGTTQGGGFNDKTILTDTNAFGLVGRSGNAWWQMWAYNYVNASDERVKKDIVDLGPEELTAALERLDQIRSVRYRYDVETSEFDPERPEKYRPLPHVGVIAQSMPDEVIANPEGPVLGVNMQDELGYTIAALRGLRIEVRRNHEEVTEAIKAVKAEKDAEIAELKKRIEKLESSK